MIVFKHRSYYDSYIVFQIKYKLHINTYQNSHNSRSRMGLDVDSIQVARYFPPILVSLLSLNK